jgi:hypothetical protein
MRGVEMPFCQLEMGAICENEKNLMKICVNGL